MAHFGAGADPDLLRGLAIIVNTADRATNQCDTCSDGAFLIWTD